MSRIIRAKRFALFSALCILLTTQAFAQDRPADPPLSFGTPEEMLSEDIVLLHGLGSSAAVWDQLVEPLSLGLRVWTFEMPGHGKTQPIHQPTIEKMANLLAEFIKANKIYKPILVGHSMGGMVALSYALDNPSQVYKLIVIDATPKQLATEKQKAAVREQLLTNYDHFISDFFMNMSPLPDVTEQILDQAMRTHQGTMTNMLLSSFEFDLTNELYYQSIPILVIGSGMMFPDPTVAQQQLDMMGYENAQTISFKSMQNSGTFLMLEQPKYLASIILAYSVIH